MWINVALLLLQVGSMPGSAAAKGPLYKYLKLAGAMSEQHFEDGQGAYQESPSAGAKVPGLEEDAQQKPEHLEQKPSLSQPVGSQPSGSNSHADTPGGLSGIFGGIQNGTVLDLVAKLAGTTSVDKNNADDVAAKLKEHVQLGVRAHDQQEGETKSKLTGKEEQLLATLQAAIASGNVDSKSTLGNKYRKEHGKLI